MSKRYLVRAEESGGTTVDACVVWVDQSVLDAALSALRRAKEDLPTLEELVLTERNSGISARFGSLYVSRLEEVEGAEGSYDYDAAGSLELDGEKWEPGDEDDLIDSSDEDFGSVRVHVRDGSWYVTAFFNDGDDRAESANVVL